MKKQCSYPAYRNVTIFGLPSAANNSIRSIANLKHEIGIAVSALSSIAELRIHLQRLMNRVGLAGTA